MSIRSWPIKPMLDWQVLKLVAHSAFRCLLNLKTHTFKILSLLWLEVDIIICQAAASWQS